MYCSHFTLKYTINKLNIAQPQITDGRHPIGDLVSWPGGKIEIAL